MVNIVIQNFVICFDLEVFFSCEYDECEICLNVRESVSAIALFDRHMTFKLSQWLQIVYAKISSVYNDYHIIIMKIWSISN